MTLEQTDVYDEKDRQRGVASHQKDLVDHTFDKAWRWCTDTEMQNHLTVNDDFVIS